MNTKNRFFLGALLISLGLDQASKIWARASLKPRFPDVMSIIPGYFELRYAENTGAAFSVFRSLPGARVIFLVIGAIALGVVYRYLRQLDAKNWRVAMELGLLAGGAIGNLADRAIYGRVTDFIVWRVGTHEWPTFNIADAALLVGIVGLFFDMKPDNTKATAKS